jgi:hypothetical protein
VKIIFYRHSVPNGTLAGAGLSVPKINRKRDTGYKPAPASLQARAGKKAIRKMPVITELQGLSTEPYIMPQALFMNNPRLKPRVGE